MSNQFDNPYAPPSAASMANRPSQDGPDQLAGRFTRFAATLVDGILVMAILFPIQFMTGFIARTQLQVVGIAEQFGMMLLGIATMLLLNGYLLATRGQTIGKMLTGIQIVDFRNGGKLPFLRVYVYRYLWTTPFAILAVLIPGPTDDLAINLIILVDVLFIFGADRRCIHDLIAGSKVVLYRDNRPQLDS